MPLPTATEAAAAAKQTYASIEKLFEDRLRRAIEDRHSSANIIFDLVNYTRHHDAVISKLRELNYLVKIDAQPNSKPPMIEIQISWEHLT